MAIYLLEDVASTFAGDLVLDPKGDLQLANPLETTKAAANFLLRTDHGDYAPDATIGANLGTFIGLNMSAEILDLAQSQIYRTIAHNLMTKTDVRVTVVPTDYQELTCFVELFGKYAISGEWVSPPGETMIYSFPYANGAIEPLTLP